ncbi:DUF354 domain-containing protein [Halorarius halobius]|uniref:DUF354 domain-containing protein n=1 Tax=Halorarius halobius TaxID=2962671 RepID=UPI0020CB6FA1|nr:DUF354 domain-containing protein [Halorarius halobius]
MTMAGDARSDGHGTVVPSALPSPVVVTIQHPAHVHFFRHGIRELEAAGVDVHVFAREKDVARDLLDVYDIDHRMLAGTSGSALSLARVQATYEWRLLRAVRRIRPAVITAIGGVAASHVAPLVGARSLVFADTEHARLQNRLSFPFAHRVCTPVGYRGDAGPKQVRYPGYHELAYLHPDRFVPSRAPFDATDLSPEEPLVVLRVVAWDAAHDLGKQGLTGLEAVVERLEAAGGHVVISSQATLPRALEPYRYSLPPHEMHHLLAHADLFVGESATMATEAAVLGTPAVYISHWETGYTAELEREFGLLFNHTADDAARRQRRGLARAEALLDDDGTDWESRRRHLLAERRDTTDVLLEQLADVGHRVDD